MDLVAEAEAREEEARACFAEHDVDSSGSIDAAELLSVFRTLGLERDADQEDEAFEARVGRCLREHDTNADGVLSFDEFSLFKPCRHTGGACNARPRERLKRARSDAEEEAATALLHEPVAAIPDGKHAVGAADGRDGRG